MQLPENTVIAYKVQELIGACIGVSCMHFISSLTCLQLLTFVFFLSVGSELNVNDDDKLGADGGTLSAELISDESINCLDKVLEGMLSFTGWCMLLGSP